MRKKAQHEHKSPVYARAYVVSKDRVPRAHEIARCRDAVAALDLPALDKLYGPNDWVDFVHDVRSDEVAVVAKLDVLDERPVPVGSRPGGNFMRRVAEITATSAYVLDVAAGLTSSDLGWFDHVEATHNRITRGRALPSEKAKRMARRKKKLHPGVVVQWKELEGTKAHARVAQHWRDPAIANAQEAIDTAPNIAENLRGASVATWTRIFGGRTGGRNTRAKRRT